MTTEIAVAVAAVSVAFAAGVVWPDVRRRRPTGHRPSTPPPNEPVLPAGHVTFANRPPMEVADEIAATAEEAEGHEHRPSTRREVEAIRRKQPRRRRRRKGR